MLPRIWILQDNTGAETCLFGTCRSTAGSQAQPGHQLPVCDYDDGHCHSGNFMQSRLTLSITSPVIQCVLNFVIN